MTKIKKTVKLQKVFKISPFENYWTGKNVILTLISIVILTVGYLLMAQGPWDNPVSLTYSPIILIIAYVIVIPAAIMYYGKKKKVSDNNQSSE